MTSFPENKIVEFETVPAAPTEAAVQEIEIDVRQMSDKGFEFERDAAAAFTGELFGSVSGNIWTSISVLAATAQGAIPAHFNLVKAKITVQGVLGGDTSLYIGGKVL